MVLVGGRSEGEKTSTAMKVRVYIGASIIWFFQVFISDSQYLDRDVTRRRFSNRTIGIVSTNRARYGIADNDALTSSWISTKLLSSCIEAPSENGQTETKLAILSVSVFELWLSHHMRNFLFR